MTTETDPSQEPNEPNEFGFAGDPTGPQPNPEPASTDAVDAEATAVPSGDLTGALNAAIEERTAGD